ncbi:MAG TPA: slipin family protein [Candidatus Bathyarchaeia archaeon]|nr:slipin family protein [Candidatus Bathyarchaeia archaeon]
MDFLTLMAALGIIVFIILYILASMIKIVREYERAVIFRLGRLIGAKGPGLFIKYPVMDTFKKIDLRVITIDVPRQSTITKDNVTVTVDAVVYFRVSDPVLAVTKVEQYFHATDLMAQTTLRDVLGQATLDEILAKRDELGKRVSSIVDELTDPWGVKVTAVTIREVVLPESIMRAIARQAEADREKRSRVIIAEGEYAASKMLVEAGKLIAEQPLAMKLRELQTLSEIAREKNLIVVTSTTDIKELGTIIAMGQKDKAKGKNE